MSLAARVDEEVPVLIVGGGGAGLTASMLLARQGVEHLLVSARATTSDLPKAYVLNQRAVEVLDDVGVAEAIARRSTPAEQMSATVFYAGFTGPDPALETASGREYVVDCEYLLGADGGRRIPGLIGVDYEGLGVVTQTATLHVSADFSRWAKDPDVLIRWIFSARAGVLVVMVPMGPDHWGPNSEEWVIHLNYPVECA
jgi:FAD binding domain